MLPSSVRGSGPRHQPIIGGGRATIRVFEAAQRIVRAGNIKSEVVRIAQESGIDLIVLGSRERHGVSILFNQTEDTVLHAAPCDVLAVRWNRK